MRAAGRLRVLGVAVPDVSDWREPLPSGKWSQFFAALGQRFELVDVVQPELSAADRYLNLAHSFSVSKRVWKARAGFNSGLVKRRTEAVQRALGRHAGSYDLIMLLQTLCTPGFDRGAVPYAVYTDTTMALIQRVYPAWAPLPRDAATRWTRFEAEVCRQAEAVFTCSEFARGSMVEDYECSPARVVSVGAGTNQWLETLDGKDYGSRRAVFVGMDFARKGGEVLLSAWPKVRDRVPGAELVVAGPKRAPRGSRLAGIRWAGRIDRAELAELYRSASVFVLPSLFEPWGFVFFEAMGHGLPCIGTTCCAMPEIIDDGVTGRLVPCGQPEPLAATLSELLANPAKAAEMGGAAHAKVLNGNSWGDVAERIASYLEDAPATKLHLA